MCEHFWSFVEIKYGNDVWRCDVCGEPLEQPVDCTGGPIDYSAGLWHCETHDAEYTAEGLCEECYHDMQYGDVRMSDEGGASDD